MARLPDLNGAILDRLDDWQALESEEESIKRLLHVCHDPIAQRQIIEERERIDNRQDAVIEQLRRDLAAFRHTHLAAVAAFVRAEPTVAEIGERVMARRVAERRPVYQTKEPTTFVAQPAQARGI